MTHPNTLAAKAVNDALVTDGLLDRLITVITDHRSARIKEAQQVGTMKTSGMLARFETEYEILTIIEEVFRVDLDDARNDLADECARECEYDLREASFVTNPEAAADRAAAYADWRRDDALLSEWVA